MSHQKTFFLLNLVSNECVPVFYFPPKSLFSSRIYNLCFCGLIGQTPVIDWQMGVWESPCCVSPSVKGGQAVACPSLTLEKFCPSLSHYTWTIYVDTTVNRRFKYIRYNVILKFILSIVLVICSHVISSPLCPSIMRESRGSPLLLSSPVDLSSLSLQLCLDVIVIVVTFSLRLKFSLSLSLSLSCVWFNNQVIIITQPITFTQTEWKSEGTMVRERRNQIRSRAVEYPSINDVLPLVWE